VDENDRFASSLHEVVNLDARGIKIVAVKRQTGQKKGGAEKEKFLEHGLCG
jgi:hypothetical protein